MVLCVSRLESVMKCVSKVIIVVFQTHTLEALEFAAAFLCLCFQVQSLFVSASNSRSSESSAVFACLCLKLNSAFVSASNSCRSKVSAVFLCLCFQLNSAFVFASNACSSEVLAVRLCFELHFEFVCLPSEILNLRPSSFLLISASRSCLYFTILQF